MSTHSKFREMVENLLPVTEVLAEAISKYYTVVEQPGVFEHGLLLERARMVLEELNLNGWAIVRLEPDDRGDFW